MRVVFSVFFFMVSLFASDATIDIVKKTDNMPSIKVVNQGASGVANSLAVSFHKMVIGDLQVTANFDVVSEASGGAGVHQLQYQLMANDSGGLNCQVTVIDKNGGSIYSKLYSTPQKNRYPFLSHKIINELNSKMGLSPVDWIEKFVIFAKNIASGESDIVVADYSLTFQKTVMSGGANLFPKWADYRQTSFYYTSYNYETPTLFKVNLLNGTKTKIASSDGMIVCSDVSRDGNKLVVTMAPNDQPDIYILDLRSGQQKRVTHFEGIDVNGNFIDNDRRVVFVSDRLGYPNIFAKSINGSGVEQMVYHGRNNSSCSAQDNYIVYSSRETNSEFGRNTFNLYLISTDTEYIRQLSATGVNIFPRFANDSDTVLFIKNYKHQSALGIVRLNANKSFYFPLKVGKIQSLDW
jgi:TolB protein